MGYLRKIRIRAVITAILLMACTGLSHGQKAKEWTKQKKTQIEYLTQQVLAYGVFLYQVSEGYGIAGRGLGDIGNLQGGERVLHRLFFEGLGHVAPAVRDYPLAGEALRLQAAMFLETQRAVRYLSQTGVFHGRELAAVRRFHAGVLEGALEGLAELNRVLLPGTFKLSDAQRLERVGAVYRAMEQRYAALLEYNRKAEWLARARIQELRYTGFAIQNHP